MSVNYSEIIAMLHAKKKVVNDFSTPDSGILAHMILTPTGDGKVKLEGYPMNASPKYQLSDKRTRRTSLDISKIELDIRDLAAVVARKYNKEHRPKAPQMPKTRGYIVEALQRCPNIYDEANYPDWGKTTTKGSVDYLIHSIAPAMDRIGGDICDEDMERIKEEMIEHAYGSRRAKHNKDGSVNAKRMDTARTGVDNRFRRAGIVYHWARKTCPELELPDVKFPQGEKVKKIKTEQAKALPDDVRVRFATLIFTLCSLGVTLAFGTALEFFGGLRVAEAAAPLIGELCLLPDDDFRFGKYFVAHQIVDGKRVQYLKRDSSYRHVPLTLAMVSLVEMKISQLMEDGYKRGEIYEMPFVSTPGDAERAADPDQLAAFAKELLILAGCDDQYMKEAAAIMYEHPEYVNGKPILDVTSHLCRRDLATRAAGHMTPAELDAILGHENPENAGRDYASNDTMRRLAKDLEDSFVFDPDLTQNHGYRPISLSDPEDIHLSGNTALELVNDSDHPIEIRLDLENLEPDEQLVILATPGAQFEELAHRTPTDKPADRNGRGILNRYIPEDNIRQWQAEAKSLDITAILKKYKRPAKHLIEISEI